MSNRIGIALKPRKTPVQARSAVTVEAIYEATVQVLLGFGAERLTTVRVAQRAGVSVGTLYQYFPNKQSLLFAVLKRHLGELTNSVATACGENHHQPLRVMVEAVVEAFFRAKFERRDISLALYAVSADLNGEALMNKFSKPLQGALIEMLDTCPELANSDRQTLAFVFLSALAGIARAVLEKRAPAGTARKLRQHLGATWAFVSC